jgi:hypothetical protein
MLKTSSLKLRALHFPVLAKKDELTTWNFLFLTQN